MLQHAHDMQRVLNLLHTYGTPGARAMTPLHHKQSDESEEMAPGGGAWQELQGNPLNKG